VRLDAATFVVTDTETTGLRADRDRVIEVAAVKLRGGRIVGTFQQLINPGRAVPSRITQITGISTAMLYDQPPAGAVLPEFLEFLGDGVMVCHNLPFDHRFLAAELERARLAPLECPGVCTLRLARRMLPGLPSRGLGALGAHFGITNRARHRALGDAEVTAAVLQRLLDRLTAAFGLTTVQDLVAFQHRRYRETSGEPAHIRRIRSEMLPQVPERPGVYTFRRRNGEVLYIGKAKSLASRVRSYFSAIDSHPQRLRKLVRDVRVVEWEETGSELAALLLESHRIKTLRPRDNRAGTTYRDFPFLRLDTAHDFPRLAATRGVAADGAEYYGPISRRAVAEEIVELVDQHFGLRLCDEAAWRTAARHHRPCFYREIDQCVAPCLAEPDGVYPDEVERVRRLLNGDASFLMPVLERKMQAAAERMEYEAAGRIRDQIRRLERLTARRRPFGRPLHDLHGVLLEDDARGGVQAFLLRGGRLVERVDVGLPTTEAASGGLAAALDRHFAPDAPTPLAFGRAELDEIHILSHWLRCAGVESRLIPWEPGVPAGALFEEIVRQRGMGGDGMVVVSEPEVQSAVRPPVPL
jgi:DNA polymerase III subunit epsilon